MAEKVQNQEERTWPPKEAQSHLREARSAMRESVEALFPPEFIEARRTARRELLLAARAVIDDALERTESK